MKAYLFFLATLTAISCTTLDPVRLTETGGVFRIDRGRLDYFKSQKLQEFSAPQKALTHCKRKGFSSYKITKSEAIGRYTDHTFECVK